METKHLDDGSILCRTTRGALQIWALKKGLVQVTCVGIQDAEFVGPVITSGELAISTHGRCVYMVDALDSPRMDTEFREQVSGWILKRRGANGVHAHLLQQSRLIEMAINIANMFATTPIANGYTDVDKWVAVGSQAAGELFHRRAVRDTPDRSQGSGK